MAHDTHLSAPPPHHRRTARRLMTERQLREFGVTAGLIAERCRPGGPWQQVLPKVYLLQPDPPTAAQRIRAALLYAGRRTSRDPVRPPAVVTGLAALALHRFPGAPALDDVDVVDVLVPPVRRLRDAGYVRVRRSPSLPEPVRVRDLACAPPARALADAVETLQDARRVRTLLADAVREGTSASLVGELDASGLLRRADVAEAVDAALADSRAVAEGRAFDLIRQHRLPDPVWNVSLHLPDGRFLAAVDAYWPDHGVVLDIDVRAPGFGDEDWAEEAARRERLEELGLSVLYVTPEKLRDAPQTQATVVGTALRAAGYAFFTPVTVLPR